MKMQIIFISLINISIAASEEQRIVAYQCLLANKPTMPVLHMAPIKPTLMTYDEPVKPYLDTSCPASKTVQEVYKRLNGQYKAKKHFHEQAKAIAQKKYEKEIAAWEIVQKKYEEHVAVYQIQLGVYTAMKKLYDDQLYRLSQSIRY